MLIRLMQIHEPNRKKKNRPGDEEDDDDIVEPIEEDDMVSDNEAEEIINAEANYKAQKMKARNFPLTAIYPLLPLQRIAILHDTANKRIKEQNNKRKREKAR